MMNSWHGEQVKVPQYSHQQPGHPNSEDSGTESFHNVSHREDTGDGWQPLGHHIDMYLPDTNTHTHQHHVRDANESANCSVIGKTWPAGPTCLMSPSPDELCLVGKGSTSELSSSDRVTDRMPLQLQTDINQNILYDPLPNNFDSIYSSPSIDNSSSFLSQQRLSHQDCPHQRAALGNTLPGGHTHHQPSWQHSHQSVVSGPAQIDRKSSASGNHHLHKDRHHPHQAIDDSSLGLTLLSPYASKFIGKSRPKNHHRQQLPYDPATVFTCCGDTVFIPLQNLDISFLTPDIDATSELRDGIEGTRFTITKDSRCLGGKGRYCGRPNERFFHTLHKDHEQAVCFDPRIGTLVTACGKCHPESMYPLPLCSKKEKGTRGRHSNGYICNSWASEREQRRLKLLSGQPRLATGFCFMHNESRYQSKNTYRRKTELTVKT